MRRIHVKVKPSLPGVGLRLRPAVGGEAYIKASTIFTGARPRPHQEEDEETVAAFERELEAESEDLH